MGKKKTRKSKAARSMKDLPEKTLDAKTAKAVKGGSGPTETISLPYGKIHIEY
jgi:hypothetical protein